MLAIAKVGSETDSSEMLPQLGFPIDEEIRLDQFRLLALESALDLVEHVL
jgi:hypothetical protein